MRRRVTGRRSLTSSARQRGVNGRKLDLPASRWPLLFLPELTPPHTDPASGVAVAQLWAGLYRRDGPIPTAGTPTRIGMATAGKRLPFRVLRYGWGRRYGC